MMWGAVQNGTQTSIDNINELFNSIRQETFVTPGDYGLFYVENAASLQFYDTEINPAESFVLYSDSPLSYIETELLKIKDIDPSLVFVLTLFDGQTINVQ